MNNLDTGVLFVSIDVFERLIGSLVLIVNICIIVPFFIIPSISVIIVIIIWYIVMKKSTVITK